MDRIKSYRGGFEKLDNILVYISTGEYSEKYYNKSKKLSFYIRSTNINNGLVQEDKRYFVDSNNFTKFVREGDIVTARVGTLGIFGTIDNTRNNSIYSDNVLCFRLPDTYNPYVYTLFLNSKYSKLLIDRLARGSVQQRLNQETLKEILIPIIAPSIQTQIESKIKESFRLKEESKSPLSQLQKLFRLLF
jgi:restriction endonuclease S subunit